jgi:hypothetical protein
VDFLLSYHGRGELHGLPHEERDFDDDGNPDRFVPLVNLADGIELTGPFGEPYVVKAVARERILQPADTEPSDLSLDLAEQLVIPDGSRYTTPSIGARPDINDPPAVIEGEVQ